MKTVKERAKYFINELGIPVTVFSRKVGISRVAYVRWQIGDLNLSQQTEKRISDYLSKYGF